MVVSLLALLESSLCLASPLSLSFKPTSGSQELAHMGFAPPLPSPSLKTLTGSKLAPLSSLLPQMPERGDALCPVPNMPSKINMVTMLFSVLSKTFRFFPIFSSIDERKTARGPGRRGFFQGLSQRHPLKPTEPGLVWDEYRRY